MFSAGLPVNWLIRLKLHDMRLNRNQMCARAAKIPSGGGGGGVIWRREHNRDFQRRVYSRITSRRGVKWSRRRKTPVYFPHLSLSSRSVTKHLECLLEAHPFRSVPFKVRACRASVRVSAHSEFTRLAA